MINIIHHTEGGGRMTYENWDGETVTVNPVNLPGYEYEVIDKLQFFVAKTDVAAYVSLDGSLHALYQSNQVGLRAEAWTRNAGGKVLALSIFVAPLNKYDTDTQRQARDDITNAIARYTEQAGVTPVKVMLDEIS
jgi:hypothetical protein